MPPSLIFGAGGVGEGNITHTWTNTEQTADLLVKLKGLGLTQLDSAASYPVGEPWVTDELLGEAKAAEKGFVIDTKIAIGIVVGSLTEKAIDESIQKDFELLGVDSVNILYVHVPDPVTPMDETAKAFDKHYRAGNFKKLGLCNHTTEQVEAYLKVCTEKNYVKPAIYQGHYNLLLRVDEKSLFPLLRANNISINAYGPLCGGFLTGKLSLASPEEKSKIIAGGRFDPGRFPAYKTTFDDNEVCHEAMRAFAKKCEAQGVSPTEVALRWIMWHSYLTEGDGVILGASKIQQLVGNVEFCKKQKLSEGLLKACDELWASVDGKIGNMFG